MKLIGLTGGIATGKSTVSAMLRRLGAKVVDADEIAREIVRPGEPAWQEIVDAFGPGVLRKDKSLDRDKLRKIVFADERARKRLESITHPKIRALAQEKIERLSAEGAEVVIYEAPLLFETQAQSWIRPVILVACDLETQKQRLRQRDRLGEKEIRRHLEAQMPLEEKRKLADYVVENNGSLEELQREVQEVWEKITAT